MGKQGQPEVSRTQLTIKIEGSQGGLCYAKSSCGLLGHSWGKQQNHTPRLTNIQRHLFIYKDPYVSSYTTNKLIAKLSFFWCSEFYIIWMEKDEHQKKKNTSTLSYIWVAKLFLIPINRPFFLNFNTQKKNSQLNWLLAVFNFFFSYWGSHIWRGACFPGLFFFWSLQLPFDVSPPWHVPSGRRQGSLLCY